MQDCRYKCKYTHSYINLNGLNSIGKGQIFKLHENKKISLYNKYIYTYMYVYIFPKRYI